MCLLYESDGGHAVYPKLLTYRARAYRLTGFTGVIDRMYGRTGSNALIYIVPLCITYTSQAPQLR